MASALDASLNFAAAAAKRAESTMHASSDIGFPED
jgi:hypothetical protein